MTGQWISVPCGAGQAFPAHLTLPPLGTGPGLVLVQEIWGVNAHIRAVAQQYALSGYVVLAPDIFWRLAPQVDLDYDQAGSARAFDLYQQVDTALAAQDVATAVAYLRHQPVVAGPVSTLGFCLGGQLAWRGGVAGEADAIVAYYGGGIDQHLDLAASWQRPVLFHHAGQDSHIGQDQVAAIRAAFAGHGHAQFFDYPEAEHGFNCWGRAMYRQADAALAQGRTLTFLAQQG